MKTLLIAGRFCATPEELQQLRSLGWDIARMPDETGPMPCDRAAVNAIVCNSLFQHQALAEFSGLRVVQITSAGWDRFPLEEAQERGIACYNAAGVYSIPLAEWCITRILQLLKNTSYQRMNQTAKVWHKQRDTLELNGRTAAILGLGHAAQTIAQRLRCLGVTVVGVTRRSQYVDPTYDQIEHLGDVGKWLATADIVISCLSLDETSEGFLDASVFKRSNPGTLFINLSRGGVVNERDLTDALLGGNLHGAALDVFATEPLPSDSPLWNLPNMLISPHDAFESENNWKRLFSLCFENLSRHRVSAIRSDGVGWRS